MLMLFDYQAGRLPLRDAVPLTLEQLTCAMAVPPLANEAAVPFTIRLHVS